jgi:pseudouridine-5'-phosphate glycosidase
MNKYIELSPMVAQALNEKKALVALESTIISHGMPYPKNVETAIRCEEIVLENGSIPATTAILNGKLKVGLTTVELEYLGTKGHEIAKASRRDIAYCISKQMDGSTTVAASIFIAALAGIKVFATGGIGGVHKGAETSFDISADLEELANTNIAVVCAGIKSILDIGLTMEYLETKGVPLIGYQTDVLPAFYTRESEFKVNFRANSAKEIAYMIRTNHELGFKGGMLITNPIPKKWSMDKKTIDEAVDCALKDMNKLGIKGKEQTPFLLEKVSKLTSGNSLQANIALVYNNCKLAAEISAALKESQQ